MTLNRRGFLQKSALSAVVAGQTLQRLPTADRPALASGNPPPGEPQSQPIIDTHVYLSRWPFRRLPADRTEQLVDKLRRYGVMQAWAGSFDGVFHKDMEAVNQRLVNDCRREGQGLLIPVGTVNPTLAHWREDLKQCQDEYQMPAIRLYPAYHQYTLDDRRFLELLQEAAERQMVVQIVAWMEDERHQNALMPVPEVDLAPLPECLEQAPQARVLVSNGLRSVSARQLEPLLTTQRIWFDFGKLDILNGLHLLLEHVPLQQVVFGSYMPMFYFESARLKLTESALDEQQLRSILHDNAAALCEWKRPSSDR